MQRLLLFLALFSLAACSGDTVVRENVSSSGAVGEASDSLMPTVFFAKFATQSALNSKRSFIASYHGDIEIVVYHNRKMECLWNAEGRITDETVFDGVNGFIEAISTVCIGKLQEDGTFAFRGKHVRSGPGSAFSSGTLVRESDQGDTTFSLTGTLRGGQIVGDLVIGGYFRNQGDRDQDAGVHFLASPVE